MDLADAGLSTRRTNSVLLVHGAVFFLLYVFFYGAVVPGLVKDWQENSTFSYGALIPFIAAYLVWDRWGKIRLVPIAATARGILPLVVALVLGLVGKAIGDSFTERLSMIFALGSSIYLLFGRALLGVLFFPVGYLALMIPLPYVLTKEVAYQLRFFDASLAAGALQLLGIPIYRETYFLHLPNITLEVADICAGLASIFSLFALGAFYVYFLPVASRIKTVFLLSTFPIAIFANLVRIIGISVLAYYIGPAALEMLFHQFSGTATFLLALVLLVSFGEFLRRAWGRSSAVTTSSKTPDILSLQRETAVEWRPFIAGTVIFLCALSVSALLSGGRSYVAPASGLSNFPTSLGAFAVSELDWQDRYDDPKADSSFSRIYVGSNNVPLEVFIGYKGFQNAGERLQSPKLILGEHWNFVWVKPARLDLDNSAQLQVNWMLTRGGKTARLVLYWYQFGRSTEAGELGYRINLVKRLVFDRRSDGAVIRLATPVLSDEPIENAQERLAALARQLYPQLVRILPE